MKSVTADVSYKTLLPILTAGKDRVVSGGVPGVTPQQLFFHR
jgi:hypothetical protein